MPRRFRSTLGRAYAEANSGRKGAVHLTIPVDLFTGTTEAPSRLPLPFEENAPEAGASSIETAIAMLQSAERPVVIAGSGIWWSGAERELRDFIEQTSLPLYTITMAKGAVSDEHPLNFGYADPALNHAVQRVFLETDLVLVIGKRIDYRLALGSARLFSPAAKFIQIDIHPQELGMNRDLDLAICADAKAALRQLNRAASKREWKPLPWLQHLSSLRDQWRETLHSAASNSASPLHPAAFFFELGKVLPRNVRYSWDGGDFTHWGRTILPALEPGRWLRLGPLGTIGSALPNALSLKLAHPAEPVLMITGDGSLGFYVAELDSLVRHRLPVVIIVGNDGGWGLERELQNFSSSPGAPTVACELRRTRYDIVMRGFGGEGETIDRLDQVRPAMERAFSSAVPYLLNVNIRGVRSPFTDWQIAGKKK
jgi:acetolactate synthase-1/2/3 large subunit